MNVNINNRIVSFILSRIQHYDAKKYWRLRSIVINPYDRHSKLYRLISLLYIKRCDAYNCASTGTDLGRGATFKTIPYLPHGLKGIIIHTRAQIGSNVTIYQHVTIGKNSDSGGVPEIGDNVIIGAGAVVLGGVKIGDNAIIGANAVVINDVPSNCIAVGVPAIYKQKSK